MISFKSVEVKNAKSRLLEFEAQLLFGELSVEAGAWCQRAFLIKTTVN